MYRPVIVNSQDVVYSLNKNDAVFLVSENCRIYYINTGMDILIRLQHAESDFHTETYYSSNDWLKLRILICED